MELLLLGGTAFLGRQIALSALADGHSVTCLARGSAPPPEGVTFVPGDRDDDAADALAPVAGRRWDAVVDLTSQPGRARRALRDLRADHWVLVSTANVYAGTTPAGHRETDPLTPALQAEVMAGPEDYGAAKVACEQLYAGSGTTATLVRSGLIGGAGDTSGRSGYWPWRFAHPVGDGSAVAVPDDPGFPCALVDVRDIASFVVTAARERLDGPYNVTGPTTPLSEVLATAAEVAGTAARPHPVPPARLAELGVNPWMGPRSMPLWIDDPAMRGFGTMDTSRARSDGLVTRPLAETLRAALAYEETREGERPTGLTDEEEHEVLAAVR